MADASSVSPALATLGGSGWVPVASLSAMNLGAGTFAQMKALAGVPDGSTYLVNNYGRGGSVWRYSVALADWFPIAPVKVYENTALISGALTVADQLLLAIPCEAGLLANKVFRLIFSLGRDGTTDATGTTTIRLGTAGTVADASIAAAGSLISGTVRSVGLEAWQRMASATSAEKLGGGPMAAFAAAGGSGSVLSAATVVPSVASQAVFLSITTTMAGTTNKPQLQYAALEIQP